LTFNVNSRYVSVETAAYTTPDGRKIAYLRRRFLPQGESLPLLVEVIWTEGERLDLVAARTIGDPEQFWRICDANNMMNPFDIVVEPGDTLRVPVPQIEERR
jgi:hypothetical protein